MPLVPYGFDDEVARDLSLAKDKSDTPSHLLGKQPCCDEAVDVPCHPVWNAGDSGDLREFAAQDPSLAPPSEMMSLLVSFLWKAHAQALPAPKSHTLLFVGDLTSQVRFAPLRGRFPKEIWT